MTLPPFLPNLADPAVRVERLKLLAGGLQLVAIGILLFIDNLSSLQPGAGNLL